MEEVTYRYQTRSRFGLKPLPASDQWRLWFCLVQYLAAAVKPAGKGSPEALHAHGGKGQNESNQEGSHRFESILQRESQRNLKRFFS
jgi:hypothetical protein